MSPATTPETTNTSETKKTARALTDKQKRHFRSLAHTLKPLVTVGNAGLTEAVLRELELTLEHHELIKVRINAGDRDSKKAIISSICTEINAVSVQEIGHICVLYRPAKKSKITLPK
jgi:RNA-binding protein